MGRPDLKALRRRQKHCLDVIETVLIVVIIVSIAVVGILSMTGQHAGRIGNIINEVVTGSDTGEMGAMLLTI